MIYIYSKITANNHDKANKYKCNQMLIISTIKRQKLNSVMLRTVGPRLYAVQRERFKTHNTHTQECENVYLLYNLYNI